MAFIAPFIPAIAGGISSLLGSKASGGGGGVPDLKGLLNQQSQNITQGRNIAGSLGAPASNLLSLATSSYSPVANYFGRLLSGNRDVASSVMFPDIQRINEGYNANAQTAANLMPRGGGRSAFFAEQPFARTRDITNLLSSARSSAAPGLLQAGQAAGSQAQGLYGNILNALSGASSGTNSLLNYDLQSRAQQYNKGKDIGSSIYDFIQKLPIFGGGNKPKLGGTGYPAYPDTGVYGPGF